MLFFSFHVLSTPSFLDWLQKSAGLEGPNVKVKAPVFAFASVAESTTLKPSNNVVNFCCGVLQFEFWDLQRGEVFPPEVFHSEIIPVQKFPPPPVVQKGTNKDPVPLLLQSWPESTH